MLTTKLASAQPGFARSARDEDHGGEWDVIGSLAIAERAPS
jgi:hypothetical protein